LSIFDPKNFLSVRVHVRCFVVKVLGVRDCIVNECLCVCVREKVFNCATFLSFIVTGNGNGNGYRAPSFGGEFNLKSQCVSLCIQIVQIFQECVQTPLCFVSAYKTFCHCAFPFIKKSV